MAAPLVFDRSLLRTRLARARRAGYADFLLRRVLDDSTERLGVVLRPFPRALDIGTPTDAVARWLRERVEAQIVVRLAPVLESGRLTVLGDEEALPFAPQSFDLALSLLALQSVNDLPGALVQIRRVLRPDGLFLGCLFGGGTLAELRQAFTQAESEVEGGASPRVFPFAELRDLGGLLQRAGFALPVADLESVTVRYPNLFALMRDLRAMGLTNILIDRRKTPLRRRTLFRTAELYAERFSDPDGRIRATFEICWLLGWAPHESQQKPLPRGSAHVSLAEALRPKERSR